jgi:hypothetical protein
MLLLQCVFRHLWMSFLGVRVCRVVLAAVVGKLSCTTVVELLCMQCIVAQCIFVQGGPKGNGMLLPCQAQCNTLTGLLPPDSVCVGCTHFGKHHAQDGSGMPGPLVLCRS